MKCLLVIFFLSVFMSVFGILKMLNESLMNSVPQYLCYPDTHMDHHENIKPLCEPDKRYHAVIVIDSACKNFAARQAVRATWGNQSYYASLGYKVRTFFTLGNPDWIDADLREKVLKERDVYGDIVFINIVEHYKSIIHKVMYGLKSVQRFCSNTDMVVKADDDIFVDIVRLHTKFTGDSKLRSSLWCSAAKGTPSRDPANTWFVDPRVYNKTYPSYCLGSFYTLNITSLSVLIRMAYCEPWFWIDDVFIAGDLRTRANIPLRGLDSSEQYLSAGYNIYGERVDEISAKKLKILYHHLITPEAMHHLWKLKIFRTK